MISSRIKSPKLQAWYQATRPPCIHRHLCAISAGGGNRSRRPRVQTTSLLLALLGTLLLQTGANLVNEYFDYIRGADELKEAGQGMTIKHQILTPKEVLLGAILTLLAGALIGVYLVSQSGELLWLIGGIGVLVAITYTAGPFPLAYNGLGELTAGIVFGPLVIIGAYYVMETSLSSRLIWVSIPIGLMVAAILHANNIRDYAADKAVNKRTTTVLFGLSFARKEYAVLIFGAYLSLAVLVILQLAPPLTLLALLTLPQAYPLVVTIYTERDAQRLHIAQGRTARLHGHFGYMMTGGWILWLILIAL